MEWRSAVSRSISRKERGLISESEVSPSEYLRE